MSDQDLLDLLKDEDDDGDQGDQNGDLTELKQLVLDLKKENQGLLQAKQEEKRKRQDNQKRLENIESTLNKILETKNKAADVVKDADSKVNGIPVQFTEDGEAFIPQNILNDLLKPHQQAVDKLKDDLETTKSASEASKQVDKIIQGIISEDERFPAVYKDYVKARNWIEHKVIDYQKDNNLRGPMTSAQALTVVFNQDVEKEFNEKFPGMDLELVTIAEDSERLFRKMLKGHLVQDTQTPDDNNDKQRINKIMKKPSNLGGLSNARSKDDEGSLATRIGDISYDDMLKLSDKEINTLLSALKEEELRG